MNKDYLKALEISENALSQLKSIYDKATTGAFEDKKACRALEKIVENLEDFTRDIKHFSKEAQEGFLRLNSNGKYVLAESELSCGYPIELYNAEYQEWEDGRIEHSSKYGGYYFYNNDDSNRCLNEGMKARIRV